MRRFASLRRQSDFARLRRRGRRINAATFTAFRGERRPGESLPVVGITVAKAVGNAVVRNRLRRRIAAILNECLDPARPEQILIVARPSAAGLAFPVLRSQVLAALP
ncbi:MAG: ribonuclease P protein component [Candidatus Eremiobacteraeota bacterium]|nr:ribonuclease P protein component [Candidatus Eremiobacteraeota bacterium]